MTEYDLPEYAPGEGDAAIRGEMVQYLVEVVRQRPEGRQMQTAVHAAAFVIRAIDAHRSPEATLIEILGSDEAALEWMRVTIPKLEARIGRRLAKGAGDDG